MDYLRTYFAKSTPGGLVILGVIVGAGGAVGAALFHTLISLSTTLFFGFGSSSEFTTLTTELPAWHRLLIPTLGGLLVGVIFAIAKVTEAEGEGVPEVTEALTHKKGTIRPIVAPIKIITAAVTLGSGGSAGREGPVIQIGSAIGSSVAQFFGLATKERSLLLAAGAAAAIGGAFGAPIAGVLFTIEILKHRTPRLTQTVVIAIAAFVGTYGARLLTEYEGLRFEVHGGLPFSLQSLSIVITLGILAAITGILFGKILDITRIQFKKIHLPHYSKPALGGFLIGLIALFAPHIHEPAAYPLMTDLVTISTVPLTFLGILLITKMLATSITLGSGGSGGIFAPLLLMGAILGSVLASALVVFSILPSSLSPAVVILGMAAVFAGAAHAPLTAAFITYEMTNNLDLLPSLIVICFIASVVAKRIQKDSVYRVHD